MQLAVSTYSLARWRRENGKTLEQSLDWLAENNIAGVEFVGVGDPPKSQANTPSLKRAASLRKRCEKLGLKIVGYCTGAEFLVSPAEQKRVVEQVQAEVDVAAELGVGNMRHDVTRGPKPDAPAMTFAQVLQAIVPAIREVADYAEQKGVITTLENHGFYMQAPERVEKLLKTVDHPNFALTIDLGNFLCVDADPVEAVRRLADYVVMAHAKDFFKRPKTQMPPSGWFATPTKIALRGAIAGHGVLDLPKQIQLLKKAGYDGWLSLEFEGMEEPTQGIKLGLEYLSKLV